MELGAKRSSAIAFAIAAASLVVLSCSPEPRINRNEILETIRRELPMGSTRDQAIQYIDGGGRGKRLMRGDEIQEIQRLRDAVSAGAELEIPDGAVEFVTAVMRGSEGLYTPEWLIIMFYFDGDGRLIGNEIKSSKKI